MGGGGTTGGTRTDVFNAQVDGVAVSCAHVGANRAAAALHLLALAFIYWSGLHFIGQSRDRMKVGQKVVGNPCSAATPPPQKRVKKARSC